MSFEACASKHALSASYPSTSVGDRKPSPTGCEMGTQGKGIVPGWPRPHDPYPHKFSVSRRTTGWNLYTHRLRRRDLWLLVPSVTTGSSRTKTHDESSPERSTWRSRPAASTDIWTGDESQPIGELASSEWDNEWQPYFGRLRCLRCSHDSCWHVQAWGKRKVPATMEDPRFHQTLRNSPRYRTHANERIVSRNPKLRSCVDDFELLERVRWPSTTPWPCHTTVVGPVKMDLG